jgi:hypothetical protein
VFVTDRLACQVESTGLEISVTMLVAGRVVTGQLCPFDRYVRWERETYFRAARCGGSFSAGGEMPPPSPTEREQAAVRFQEEYGDDSAAAAEISFPLLALRNPRIDPGTPTEAALGGYLAISASHVAAISLGTRGTG